MRITTALLAGGALVVLSASSAFAAPASNGGWTGPYVGLSLGGQWTDTSWTTTSIELGSDPLRTGNPATAGLDGSGFRIGGYAGYSWQVAPNWVLGVEGDIGWDDAKGRAGPIPATVANANQCNTANCALDHISDTETWDGSVRARAGYLVTPTWLVYATGGVQWQESQIQAVCGVGGPWCVANRNQTASFSRTGWTLGGGVETKFAPNWIGRAEYRYADLGTVSHTFFANAQIDAVGMREPLRTNTFDVGIGYLF
jgi:outer membrane immunogenic protein